MSAANWSIDGDMFVVLVNGDEQYAIWPSAKPVPDGWAEACPARAKTHCLDFVEARWTDLRPKTLLDEHGQC